MPIVLDRAGSSRVLATELEASGAQAGRLEFAAAELPAFVSAQPADTRWVWESTPRWYPALLEAGVRVERCVDLELCHRILATSLLTADSELARSPRAEWAVPDASAAVPVGDPAAALFEFDEVESAAGGARARDAVAEFALQSAAVAGSDEPGRIRLLLAAESAGALIAAEIRHAGLPWRAEVHEELLAEALGPRVPAGRRPAKLEALADRVRELLGDPALNPDSQHELLASLRRTGLPVRSTRAWELRELDHPAIASVLEYRKLARLHSANGWAWLDQWVVDGRFHPEYVVGGVVTGRWASSGGGALQLPKNVRRAVQADPGWKLVVADAAQLEPRILAGLAGDEAMADAGRGRDFYDAVVASGLVESRRQAKVAMLGAMYGATTGDSARLMPRLSRAFPRAIRYVDAAAAAGERGEQLVSRLGRTSPKPNPAWREAQARATEPSATAVDERRARSRTRDWGRFTRNFVVQASAAEWALCWLAEVRRRLMELAPGPLEAAPHLVFFLHDELVVHTPARHADEVGGILVDAAAQAGRLMFGTFPIDFPLTIASVDSYADAK